MLDSSVAEELQCIVLRLDWFCSSKSGGKDRDGGTKRVRRSKGGAFHVAMAAKIWVIDGES